MRIKIGDDVGYKSVKTDSKFHHIGKVIELAPDGIPSVREPMLKIKGKAGFVLESHCILFPRRPTAEEINSCPESVKTYIHELITSEPGSTVQDHIAQRDNAAGLAIIVEELRSDAIKLEATIGSLRESIESQTIRAMKAEARIQTIDDGLASAMESEGIAKEELRLAGGRIKELENEAKAIDETLIEEKERADSMQHERDEYVDDRDAWSRRAKELELCNIQQLETIAKLQAPISGDEVFLRGRVQELEKATKDLQTESDDELRKRRLADERAGFAAKQTDRIAAERDLATARVNELERGLAELVKNQKGLKSTIAEMAREEARRWRDIAWAAMVGQGGGRSKEEALVRIEGAADENVKRLEKHGEDIKIIMEIKPDGS